MLSSILLLFLLLKKEDKVAGYIYAIAIWTLICFAMTEILSAFHMISTKILWMCWGIVAISLLVLNVIKYKQNSLESIKALFRKEKLKKEYLVWGFFGVVMLVLAVKTVPYNWDSMTYHLPRLVHWAQNGSVEYYATAIDRQVSSPLGGAYVNLHIYVMSGGSDRFLNLLQCCSFLTNGMLVYGIAKKIGCSRNYCNMAILLFYSMPIAFAEAFTTQVDNFSALWMLATVYLLLDLLRYENRLEWDKKTFGRVIALSLCVAFGYLTKPSIGIGLLLFVIWLLIMVIKRKDKLISIMFYLLTAGFLFAALLMPGLGRNIATFDAFSAPEVGQRQLIGTLEPKEVFVNCIKNITFNMPVVWIYDSSSILYNGVMGVSEFLDVDINDPAISEDGKEFLIHSSQEYDHDTAINPVIVYLLLLCTAFWIVQVKKKQLQEIRNTYFLVAGLSFIMFCAVLRWEPFVSRYMISYLAVLCPALSAQMELFVERTGNEKHRVIGSKVKAFIYFFCLTELFGLFYHHGTIALTKSRYEGYFVNREDIEESYRKTSEIINDKKCENIGLLIGADSYEYPLTVMLENYSRIEHVNVKNMTAKYEDIGFIPDIIISIDCELEENTVNCHGVEYQVTKVIDDNVSLLERVG